VGVPVPTVVIASSLARWLTPAPGASVGERSFTVSGTTVREVLESLFALYPQLRDYVTDERGTLRHHVVCFVDGVAVQDKVSLNEAVPANGEVHIFQALSGG
jgi:hypothetical protein